VPSDEVNDLVKNCFEAYRVAIMFADPYRWQDYLDAWSALFPDKIVEFPTNVETKMDKAIERFTTSHANNELCHDGSAILTSHVKNAVIVKGSRKKPRPGEEEIIATHYLKMAKRGNGMLIDAGVAAVLAYEARAYSIEKGLEETPVEAWGFYR
jgi:phage terminase large subunit-like protein